MQVFALVGVQPDIGILADFGQKKPFLGLFATFIRFFRILGATCTVTLLYP